MNSSLPLLASLICISIPAVAAADSWSHSEDHQPANAASIRVVEPDGYQVTINGKTDTLPAVFHVPNADNYFVMTVRAPSGATWERKLEVRSYKQNVVRIKHAVDAPVAQPAAKKAASYVGVIANTTHMCKKPEDRRDVRFELVLGADVVKVVDVVKRSRVDVELPAGEYRVRQFLKNGDQWQYASVSTQNVAKDGWIIHYGCN